MAKILLRKEKKARVEGRDIIVVKPKRYYVDNLSKDFHTQYGTIDKKDLKKIGKITTKDTKKEFIIFPAAFADDFRRIKRAPQTMPPKDIGLIIAEIGLGKESVVVDAGTGSGAAAILLSRVCKKVSTYDTNKKHLDIARENIEMLKIENVTIKEGSIYEPITEKNADLVLLDVPQPEKALETAIKAVKLGGFIVAYTIQATQLQSFVNAVRKRENMSVVKSVELMERSWKVQDKIVRPSSDSIGHSAFLTFARRIL